MMYYWLAFGAGFLIGAASVPVGVSLWLSWGIQRGKIL